MEKLLHQNLVFSQEDVRKNILLPFQLDKTYDRLVIHVHYSPKAIRDKDIIMPQIRACVKKYMPAGYDLTEEDMKEYDKLLNFVTLSLDKDGSYVGCAHRHPPEQTITISPRGSTYGFAPESVTPGAWRIVLHVQAVVAGSVDFSLEVYGLEKGEREDAISAI